MVVTLVMIVRDRVSFRLRFRISIIPAFLYRRIVGAMFLDAPAADAPHLRIPRGPALAIAIVVLFTLAFGIYPEPLLNLADHALLTVSSTAGH